MGASEFKDGWLVVVAGFIVCFVVDGLLYSYGIYLIELIDAFGGSRSSTALIGSIEHGAMCLIGPIAGSLADKFGSRLLIIFGSLMAVAGLLASVFAKSLPIMYLTYGFFGGAGMGLMWLPAVTCVIKHFDKRRAFASGLANCGSGLGTFAISTLSTLLINEYGWRMTLLIMAGLMLNGVPCGLLLVSPKTTREPNKQYRPDNDSSSTTQIVHIKNAIKSTFHIFKTMVQENINLMKDKTCFFIMLSSFFVTLAFMIPFSLLPDQVTQSGLSKTDASWLVSSIGICNTIGRLLFGWLGDRSCSNRRAMLESMILLQGISIAMMPILPTFETKLIMTSLFGISFGGYIILLPVVLTDEFGPEKIGKSLGLIMFTLGVATLIGTPFAGWIYDSSHNYNLSFYVAGGENLVAVVCLQILRLINVFRGTNVVITASTHM